MGAKSHDLHIDKALTNMAMGYRPDGFIADMLFPIVPVQKQSDIYTIFSRADKLRRQTTRRAPGNEARRIEQSVSSDTFFCKNYALKSPVTLEDRENADPILLEGIVNGRAELVLDGLYLDWEVRVANQVTSGSNVGSYYATTSGWNVTQGDGDPLADVFEDIDNVWNSTGKRPNRVVYGKDAWESFRKHKNVRNIINGVNNGGGYVTRQQVAALLEVDEILVGGAFQNTGDENLAEALETIWSDNVLTYFAPSAPTMDRPSFGYSFRWSRPNIPAMAIERHPFDSKTKSEEVEAGYYQDEKITGAEYGVLRTNVNSSS